MSNNRLHAAARSMTVVAIETGRLVRGPCEVCGHAKTDAHHDDYSRPLDIRWLCRDHHIEHHDDHGFAERGPGRPPRAGVRSGSRIEIRVTAAERRAWTRAAGKQTLSDWLRTLANEAAA
jgi:hypothetical protein